MQKLVLREWKASTPAVLPVGRQIVFAPRAGARGETPSTRSQPTGAQRDEKTMSPLVCVGGQLVRLASHPLSCRLRIPL